MKDARFDIDIERLVLHGVAPADRGRFVAAFERELTRLFAPADRDSSARRRAAPGGVEHTAHAAAAQVHSAITPQLAPTTKEKR